MPEFTQLLILRNTSDLMSGFFLDLAYDLRQMKTKIFSVLTFFLLLFFICCRTAFLVPTTEDENRMNLSGKRYSLTELNDGYRIFVLKCASCHVLPIPSRHTEADWMKILPVMKIRARLDSLQSDRLEKYILTKLDRVSGK